MPVIEINAIGRFDDGLEGIGYAWVEADHETADPREIMGMSRLDNSEISRFDQGLNRLIVLRPRTRP